MKKRFSIFENIRNHANMVGVSMITLSFLDNKTEKKFRNEYFKKSLIIFRVSFITLILLYSAFGYLDVTTSEDFYRSFFVIRYLIVLPLLLAVFLFSYHKYFEKIWQELLSICFVVGGSGIIYMLLKNPDNIYYYGGMFLIFMAGYFFIKLRFFTALISGILLIILYNIGTFIFHSLYNIQFDYLVSTNAFYISANIISLIALYNIEFLERKDFSQRNLLIEKQNEITLINQSLEIKVNERTKLLDKRNAKLLDEIKNRKKIERKLIITKEKAEESDQLKSAFLANMSHEIRTPMNGILGFTDLLLEPGLTGDNKQKYINLIKKSSDRMLNTINGLMDISMIESGHVKVLNSDTIINEQAESIYLFYKSEVEKKGIKLILKKPYPDTVFIIKTDHIKLYAILSNLIKNAIKYTQKGSIEFGYSKIKNNLQFFVKDTGIGIPDNRQHAIFDRFVQADIQDKKAHDGSGLGLSISKAYVEMLGGKIWLESKEGKGSTFYFTIPIAVSEIFKSKEEKETENKNILQKIIEPKSKTILIVEDVEPSFEFLKIVLENEGYNTIWAENGKKSIEYCKTNTSISLVLMDINMPKMNGYDATKEIKKFKPNLPIIAQTAYAIAGDREKSLDAGCDDYISKPIKQKMLMEKIEKLLS